MKKVKKNLGYFVAIMASVMVLGLGSTLAATLDSTNDTTGANSTNTAKTEHENKIKVKNENKTDVKNDAYVKANTGHNSADKNTGDGSVDTGDIDVTLDIAAVLGFEDGLDIDLSDFDLTVSNDTTGFNSENDAIAKLKNKIDIRNENSTKLNNKLKADLNTGHNSADKNTGNGTVNTGDVSFGGDWGSDIVFGGSGLGSLSLNGSASASNSNTGASSSNTAKAEVKNDVKVENKNKTDINNCINIKANTGQNSADKNTGDGSVSTGDITGELNLSTTIN